MARQRLILGLLLIFAVTPFAQAAPIVEVVVTKPAIKVTERLVLDLEFRWDQTEGEYVFALPDLALQNLTLIQRSQSLETIAIGETIWRKKTFTYVFQPEQKGQAKLLDFTVPYLEPSSQKGGQLEIAPIEVTILPDLTKQFQIFTGIGGILLIVFSVFIGYRIFRRPKQQPARPDSQSPEMDEIQRILRTASGLKESVEELSLCLRRILVKHYGISSASASEREILNAVEQSDLMREEKNKIRGLFTKISETKYSGIPLSEVEYQQLRDELAQVIREKSIYLETSNATP